MRPGHRVDIEKRLYGRELSFFCFTDGYTIIPMVAAQDYKRARENDEGKNTGGMGAYSPHPWLDDDLVKNIMSKVAEPLIRGVREKYDIVYRGILYLGLMLVESGTEVTPYVLEINIRLGDPEAQVILPRLRTDLVDISEAITTGKLNRIKPEWDPNYRVVPYCHERSDQGQKRLVQGLSGPLQNRRAYRRSGSDRQEMPGFSFGHGKERFRPIGYDRRKGAVHSEFRKHS